MNTSLSFQTSGPASGKKPSQMVVLLHGLGANGADLLSLAPYWSSSLPEAIFVAPDAPDSCDMAPFGYQWFSLQDRSPDAMEKGARRAVPLLNKFLDEQLAAHSITPDKMALVGFSQGTMMALFAAPRRHLPPAAVVGYSGALIGAAALVDETTGKFPVLLVHGDADPVVPFMAMTHAEQNLRTAGFSVTALSRPGLGHSIDPEGLSAGAAFLRQSFAAKP